MEPAALDAVDRRRQSWVQPKTDTMPLSQEKIAPLQVEVEFLI